MYGIIRMSKDGSRKQVAEGLTFGEAFGQVAQLRGKQDGNFYWIGGVAE